MAEEIQGANSTPTPMPPTPSQTVPSLDHYQKIVDMSHKEIEWVHKAYSRLLVLVALLIGVGFYFSYNTIRDFKKEIKDETASTTTRALKEMDIHVAAQFAAPNIRKILEDVARTRATEIIDQQVNPAISEAKSSINKLQEQLRQNVDKILGDFKTELEALHVEVDFQKKMREIQDLQSSAIIHCDLRALAALRGYYSGIDELDRAALSAVSLIRVFYSSDVPYWQRSEGIIRNPLPYYELMNIPTNELLEKLTSNQHDNLPIVHILKNRRECGVPEALLMVMNSDQLSDTLCVRSAAMRAFQEITFFQAVDIFDGQEAQAWYISNRDTIRKNVGCNE